MFPHKRGPCLTDAVAAYIQHLTAAGRARSTLHLYEYLLSHFADELGAHRKFGSISQEEMVAYLAKFRAELSCNYATLIARVIKGFTRWLAIEGYIRGDPLVNIAVSRPPETPVIPFREDEVARLVAATETPMERAVVLLLLDCGLRASELCGLRWEHIDLVAGSFRVRGKGGATRLLALNEVVREALANYLRELSLVNGSVLPLPFDRAALERLIDAIAHRAGVPNAYPHRFRHTWACRLTEAEVSPFTMQYLGGWRSLEMVARYTRAIQKMKALEEHRRHPVAI